MHAALRVTLVPLMMLLIPDVARSDVYIDKSSPNFSAEEVMMIVDHEPLTTAFRTDPWLLRRVMDAVRAEPAAEADDEVEENDDKAAPEAAHDLFQMLKKLKAGGGGGVK